MQAALGVKNLFGGLSNLGLQGRILPLGTQVGFVELGGCGGTSLFAEGRGKAYPKVLGDEKTILLVGDPIPAC